MAIHPEKAKKRLGKVIRAMREEMGLSQEEFASLCGVHRTYMGSIERGERNPSVVNIIKIANGLKTDLSEIFIAAKL